MKIIVGLGNQGRQYRFNRHNIGFRCIDYIAEKYSIQLNKRLCQSDTGRGVISGTEVMLAKPRTYVNLSGKAVSGLLDKFNTDAEDLLVIHDDLDLSMGRIRLRIGGRSGGHRGIKSIIDSIGSQDFCRIRIGISRPVQESDSSYKDKDEIIEYVLGDFTAQEEDLILSTITSAADAIECVLTDGIAVAMNRFNRRSTNL